MAASTSFTGAPTVTSAGSIRRAFPTRTLPVDRADQAFPAKGAPPRRPALDLRKDGSERPDHPRGHSPGAEGKQQEAGDSGDRPKGGPGERPPRRGDFLPG